MDKTIETYSQIYQDYATRSSLNSMQRELDEFINMLSGRQVLDVGCAQGRDSCYLAQNGLQVTGIDLTPEFIKLAKINCPQGSFELMDMRNLTFQANSFDGLWVCASFLHLPKKDALETLAGFRRALKPTGIMFLSVMEGEFEGLRKNEELKWDARYFSHYQTQELETLLTKTGFKIEKLGKTQTSWGPLFLGYLCSIKHNDTNS